MTPMFHSFVWHINWIIIIMTPTFHSASWYCTHTTCIIIIMTPTFQLDGIPHLIISHPPIVLPFRSFPFSISYFFHISISHFPVLRSPWDIDCFRVTRSQGRFIVIFRLSICHPFLLSSLRIADYGLWLGEINCSSCWRFWRNDRTYVYRRIFRLFSLLVLSSIDIDFGSHILILARWAETVTLMY